MLTADDKKKKIGWLVVITIVLILSVVLALRDTGLIFEKPENLCDISTPPKANTIFLFDFSDPVTNEITKLIKANVRAHQDSIEVGGRLTLLRITPDEYEEDRAICKPPNPSVRNKNWRCDTKLGGIDKTSQDNANRFCKFSEGMEETVSKINEYAHQSLPSSPLIESLSAISHRTDFISANIRKIVLFSDLLQNTNNYSFYSGRGPQPDVDTVIRDNTNDLSNLSGVEIEVYYIQRSQSVRVYNFWKDLFEKLMVKSTSIIPLHHQSP